MPFIGQEGSPGGGSRSIIAAPLSSIVVEWGDVADTNGGNNEASVG